MTNTELRNELLAQHARLRELATVVRAAAEQPDLGPPQMGELRTLIARLGTELLTHNIFEEQSLHAVLRDLDAWGPQRERRVEDHHAAEHEAIFIALVAAREQRDPAALAAETLAVLGELTTHMDREERELLRADVLCDDIITSGVGG